MAGPIVYRFPVGLSGLIPDDEPEPPPPPPTHSPCSRCGTRVELPPSPHFATVCGARCQPVGEPGALKRLPVPMKDR